MQEYSFQGPDGEEIRAEEHAGIIVPILPVGALRDFRSPEVSRKLLSEIITAPEKFGSERIKRALEYLKPEFAKTGGMVCVKNTRFYEPSSCTIRY